MFLLVSQNVSCCDNIKYWKIISVSFCSIPGGVPPCLGNLNLFVVSIFIVVPVRHISLYRSQFDSLWFRFDDLLTDTSVSFEESSLRRYLLYGPFSVNFLAAISFAFLAILRFSAPDIFSSCCISNIGNPAVRFSAEELSLTAIKKLFVDICFSYKLKGTDW